MVTSTTFEIGRMPAASSRALSQTGDGPIAHVAEEPADVARAALEVLDLDVDLSGRDRSGV